MSSWQVEHKKIHIKCIFFFHCITRLHADAEKVKRTGIEWELRYWKNKRSVKTWICGKDTFWTTPWKWRTHTQHTIWHWVTFYNDDVIDTTLLHVVIHLEKRWHTRVWGHTDATHKNIRICLHSKRNQDFFASMYDVIFVKSHVSDR